MWSEPTADQAGPATRKRVARLQRAHRGRYGVLLPVIGTAVAAFVVWASMFQIDEVASAAGEVITGSRVQVIQSVDGGVLRDLRVREGDRVEPGQVLAQLDQTRFAATVGEIEARLFALKAKVARLRAEVVGHESLTFSGHLIERAPEMTAVEKALFEQRRTGLSEELRTLRVAVDLARRELVLVQDLYDAGDASGSELLRAERGLNQAEAGLINRRNRFLEDARLELTEAEDEIAQNEQLLIRRLEEQANSVFTALVPGIVKNIRVTTVGGVLRAGEELMQIVPVDDELLIEVRVRPADIAQVRSGLEASIRFEPFDYTVYGAAPGEVTYVSADTLKEESEHGTQVYYRVHVTPAGSPVRTTTGRELAIVPGMTVQVDIRTGRRSLMDVLLKPLRKTLSESFGER
ncbi:MAG: HlyD family efflux transporter periplasmic adaptor subunit [Pseudomonadales bacterium]